MVTTNGYRLPGDFGGPMNFGEYYRWNVPVLTYAFETRTDESFLDYFGVNGMLAVQQAFAILNQLPPASELNPDDFPTNTVRTNDLARDQGLLDLKSQTLALLLEQVGLANATRNIACLQGFAIVDGSLRGRVLGRNYDPVTYQVSSNVNGTVYGYNLVLTNTNQPLSAEAIEYPIDPLAPVAPAVAGASLQPGTFLTGLTRDDVGGLRYLLSSNRFNLEPLLPDVYGIGTNAESFAATVIRGGIEKITFVQPDYYEGAWGSCFFTPFTNQFTDHYVTNGAIVVQQLERVSSQPDILFASAFLDDGGAIIARVERTGSSNWTPSLEGTAGPGILRPQIRIVFNRAIGPLLQTSDSRPIGSAIKNDYRWASFDDSTNTPVVYPVGTPVHNTNHTVVQLWLHGGPNTDSLTPFIWDLPVPVGGSVVFETSTNLTDWVRLPSMPNHGTPIDWDHWASLPARFFRVLAQ